MLLCAASEAGDVEEVKRLLVECGVPPNVCGLHHKAPLHLAASQGHTTVVETLLSHGVKTYTYLYIATCTCDTYLYVRIFMTIKALQYQGQKSIRIHFAS